jgi:hypothetical protein
MNMGKKLTLAKKKTSKLIPKKKIKRASEQASRGWGEGGPEGHELKKK